MMMIRVLIIALLAALTACSPEAPDYAEASIADLQDQMHRGEVTSEQLVSWYLDRIDSLDRNGPALNAILEINPDALQIARALDEERLESGPRGPMHGIPVVLKANIDTADNMYTSAGSLALADHRPAVDAFIVSRMRDAGAVILGKANLSEWANFRSDRSSSGWSSVGGQTRNPYDTARNPCGSSSGSAVAVAANLTAVAVGTETNGSVVCPSGINGIVGIKPTLGLLSRSGIIPIAHSQDTAGPMGRSVRDAAILLGAMAGTDANDPASVALADAPNDFTSNLAADGLAGKRIGIIRSYYGAGSNPGVDELFEQNIELLRSKGAEIVDDIEIDTTDMSSASSEVLHYEFKADLNKYLQQSGAAISSLAEIIEFNKSNEDTVMPIFGQDRMLEAETKGPLTDTEYLEALATSKRVAKGALDGALSDHELDALIAPTNGPAWMTDHANGDTFHIGSSSLAAISGNPSITVPAGFVSELPIGVTFMGAFGGDKELIELGYAFEQANAARQPPQL
jgi:amidase